MKEMPGPIRHQGKKCFKFSPYYIIILVVRKLFFYFVNLKSLFLDYLLFSIISGALRRTTGEARPR